MYYIYGIINLLNNKIYIGKTSDCKRRIKQHLVGNSYISRAIKKYNINNFYFHILDETLYESYSYELEKYYIKHFNSNNNKFGYNKTNGGDAPPLRIGKLTNDQVIKIKNYKIYCKNNFIPIDFNYLKTEFNINKSLAKKILYNKLYKNIKPSLVIESNTNKNNKKCILCLKNLELSDFYKQKNTSSGLAGRCKKCFRNKNKNRLKLKIDYYILYELQKMFSYGTTISNLSKIFNISTSSIRRLLFNL